MAPLQGTGVHLLLCPWLPTNVLMMPLGSTARILVPSAMYMVPSIAIAMPLGCANLAYLAGELSPQAVSSPGIQRSPFPTT